MAERGRPSKYTAEIADRICNGIAEGITLAELCRSEDMPNRSTVYDWMKEDDEFSQRFARARLSGFDMIADEALRIADTPLEGLEVTTDSEGKVVEKRGDMLGHRKLQIETRLKLLAKWDPKRYGDKIEVENNYKAGEQPAWMKHAQGEDERPDE